MVKYIALWWDVLLTVSKSQYKSGHSTSASISFNSADTQLLRTTYITLMLQQQQMER